MVVWKFWARSEPDFAKSCKLVEIPMTHSPRRRLHLNNTSTTHSGLKAMVTKAVTATVTAGAEAAASAEVILRNKSN